MPTLARTMFWQIIQTDRKPAIRCIIVNRQGLARFLCLLVCDDCVVPLFDVLARAYGDMLGFLGGGCLSCRVEYCMIASSLFLVRFF